MAALFAPVLGGSWPAACPRWPRAVTSVLRRVHLSPGSLAASPRPSAREGTVKQRLRTLPSLLAAGLAGDSSVPPADGCRLTLGWGRSGGSTCGPRLTRVAAATAVSGASAPPDDQIKAGERGRRQMKTRESPAVRLAVHPSGARHLLPPQGYVNDAKSKSERPKLSLPVGGIRAVVVALCTWRPCRPTGYLLQ